MSGKIQIIFDGPPGPEGGEFVEVERDGKSICFGEWKQREDGYWILEFYDRPRVSMGEIQALLDHLNKEKVNAGQLGNWLRSYGVEVADELPDHEDDMGRRLAQDGYQREEEERGDVMGEKRGE